MQEIQNNSLEIYNFIKDIIYRVIRATINTIPRNKNNCFDYFSIEYIGNMNKTLYYYCNNI